jgi:hypothetical protein
MNVAQAKRELKKLGFKLNREKSKDTKSIFMCYKDDLNKEVKIEPTTTRGRFKIICSYKGDVVSCARNEMGLERVPDLVNKKKPGVPLEELLDEMDHLSKRLVSLKKRVKAEGIIS